MTTIFISIWQLLFTQIIQLYLLVLGNYISSTYSNSNSLMVLLHRLIAECTFVVTLSTEETVMRYSLMRPVNHLQHFHHRITKNYKILIDVNRHTMMQTIHFSNSSQSYSSISSWLYLWVVGQVVKNGSGDRLRW